MGQDIQLEGSPRQTREATQQAVLHLLWQGVHREQQQEDTRENTHWRKTLSVYTVWETGLPAASTQDSHESPYWRDSISMYKMSPAIQIPCYEKQPQVCRGS